MKISKFYRSSRKNYRTTEETEGLLETTGNQERLSCRSEMKLLF